MTLLPFFQIMTALQENLCACHQPLFQRRRCSVEIESCFAGTFVADTSRNVHFGAKPDKQFCLLGKEEKQMKKKALQRDMAHKCPVVDELEFVAQNKSQNSSAEFAQPAHDEDMFRYAHVQTKQAKRYRPGVKAKIYVCWKKLFGKRRKSKASR